MDLYFDPDEFPFSFDEVVDAVSLWYTRAEAITPAGQLQISAKDIRESRAIERSLETGHGKALPTPEHQQVRICSFTQFDCLWPALSILPSSRERALTWMEFHWQFRFRLLLAGARKRAGERAGTYKNHDLTPQRSRELRETGEIQEFRNYSRENFILPEATVENLVEAHNALESERAAWDALAIKARERYETHDNE